MPNKNSKSNITLDKLAEMVASGFDDIDQRFDAVDRKFDSIDKQFHSIDKQFAEVNKQFAEVKSHIRAVGGELAEFRVSVEDQNHEKRIKITEVQLNHHDRRIRRLEQTAGLAK